MEGDWPRQAREPSFIATRDKEEQMVPVQAGDSSYLCSLWQSGWSNPLHNFKHIYCHRDKLSALWAAAKPCQKKPLKSVPIPRVPAFLIRLFLSRFDMVEHSLRHIFSFLFGYCLLLHSLPPHGKLWHCFGPVAQRFRHRLVGKIC